MTIMNLTCITGVRFAINIDPVQFQVYAAECSGIGWNFELAFANNTDLNAQQPAVSVFGSATAPLLDGRGTRALVSPYHAVTVWIRGAGSGGAFQQTVSFDAVLSQNRTVGALTPLGTDPLTSYASHSSLLINDSQYAILVTAAGTYDVYR